MHIALFAAGLGLLTLSCDFALTINEILKWLSLLPIWNSECINHSGGDTVALGCCPPLLHQCTKSILICFLFGQTHFEVVSNFIYIYIYCCYSQSSALGAQKSDCYDHPNMTKQKQGLSPCTAKHPTCWVPRYCKSLLLSSYFVLSLCLH